MTLSMEGLLEAAADVARVMGAAAIARYRRGIDVRTKADGSPVTDADLAAERAGRAWLEQRFPDDAIVGEELGGTPERGRCWYLDPIDGTKSYVRGVPLWGALAGVVENGRVIAGAAAFPAVEEHIAAATGCGTWHDGHRARVSDVARLEDAVLLSTRGHIPDGALRARCAALAAGAGMVRSWGDAYGYLLVATGRAEIMIDDRLSPWDAAAVSILVDEAGGRFSNLAGAPGPFGGSGLATNAALSGTVRRALHAGAPEGEEP